MTAPEFHPAENDDIVDAELIEETSETLPFLPAVRADAEVVLPEPRPLERVALHPLMPAVFAPRRFAPEASALRRRIAWGAGHFLTVDLPVAIGIGIGRWVRGLWRWMMLSDAREAAILAGTFDTREEKIRQARISRVKQTLGGAFVLTIVALTFYWLAPPEYVAAVVAVLLVGLFMTGYQWSTPRTPVVEAPSQMGWAGSVDGIRQALIEAKLIRPDQGIGVVEHPHQVGKGYLTVIDLPPGCTVEQVKKRRREFASGLAADSGFMSIEEAGHDGRMRLWVPSGDPFSGAPKRLPLLDVGQWNAFRAAPFGETPREQVVPLRLLYSNWLGGGKPRAGKTFSARTALAPYILDPRTRIFCANGKGDPAWDALTGVAVEFIKGRKDEHAWALRGMLDRVIDEMDERYQTMTGSQVTEEDGLELWAVVVEELQNYTTNPTVTDETVHGKKNVTLGQIISSQLIDIVKNGPAAGIILFMLTQKPSDLSLPAELRDQVGTRFANKVMNHHVSNMILGSNLSALGYDASRISTQHRGLGILVPDMEEDVLGGLDLDDFPAVRPYLVDDADWDALCARGRELRIAAGTLEGQAAGESQSPHGTSHRESHTADPGDWADVVPSEIPEVLESIFDFVHHRDDRERVASRDLRARFDPEVSEKAFGDQLRRWGCPTGRDGGRGPSGPRVGDILAAVERMRGGGPIEVER
jgi:S-DNA-T family DNA segregation ATPase FtsK/SpoIIIE